MATASVGPEGKSFNSIDFYFEARIWASAGHSYKGAGMIVLASCPPSIPICRERVMSVHRQGADATCVLVNGANVRVSPLLARYLGIGDEITFPISPRDKTGIEIYITKSSVSSSPRRCLYQARIGYVPQPKLDKRNQHFVSAEVRNFIRDLVHVAAPQDSDLATG
jgi:hypothetical protein